MTAFPEELILTDVFSPNIGTDQIASAETKENAPTGIQKFADVEEIKIEIDLNKFL